MPTPLTPTQLADRWTEMIFEPAVNALSEGGPRFTPRRASRAAEVLQGPPRHAADDFADVFDQLGSTRPTLRTFIEAGRARTLSYAESAAGTDGLVRDANKLPQSLREDYAALELPTDPPVANPAAGYKWSESVLNRVMAAHGLADAAAFLAHAITADDGNKYLNRAELERAAATFGVLAPELGIVSDLDKTVVPPGELAAYPGVAALYRELELGNNGKPGDTCYVTARSPDRVTEMPAWLAAHGLPEGPIETGVSTVPWVAEREKVADIVRRFDARPDQKFVLFGDTDHRDPEVYREVKRLYPDRVTAIFMHRVNNVRADRVEGMHLIGNYAEAAAILFGLGVLDETRARRVITAARSEGLALTDAEVATLLESHRPR